MYNDDNYIKEIIAIGIVTSLIILTIVSSISIPCLISEKRNIEKEITLKQIEIYGEKVNNNQV